MSYRSRLCSSLPLTAAALCILIVVGPARAEEDRLRITPRLEVSQGFENGDLEGERTIPVDADSTAPGAGATRTVPFDRSRNGRMFEARPAIEAEGRIGALSFSATAGTQMRSSSVDRNADTRSDRAQFQTQYRFTPRFSATAGGVYDERSFDGFDSDRDAVSSGGANLVEQGRPDRRDVSGNFGMQYLLSPTSQVQASFSAISRNYDQNLSGRRDFSSNGASLSYTKNLTGRDRFQANLSYRAIRFDATPIGRLTDQTDRIATASVGWERQLGRMWTARANAGVRLLRSRDSGIRGLSGSTLGNGALDQRDTGFDGGLELVRETEMSRTQLLFRQETRPSGGQGTSVDTQLWRFGHRQRLTRDVSLSFRASFQRDENATARATSSVVPVALADRLDPITDPNDMRAPVVDASGNLLLDDSGNPQTRVPAFDSQGRRVGACGGALAVDFFDQVIPTCPGLVSSGIDDELLTLGLTLDWQMSPQLQLFISAEYRDQDRGGSRPSRSGDGDTAFERQRTSTRVRLGIRYAYDIDLF